MNSFPLIYYTIIIEKHRSLYIADKTEKAFKYLDQSLEMYEDLTDQGSQIESSEWEELKDITVKACKLADKMTELPTYQTRFKVGRNAATNACHLIHNLTCLSVFGRVIGARAFGFHGYRPVRPNFNTCRD